MWYDILWYDAIRYNIVTLQEAHPNPNSNLQRDKKTYNTA